MNESAFVSPDISNKNGALNYAWVDLGIRITLDHATTSGKAEIKFYHSNGSGDRLLLYNSVNLLSISAQDTLIKRLVNQTEGEIPWRDMLTYITNDSVKRARQGEKPIEVWPNENVTFTPEYLLEPILYRDHPNVIFGDYGTLKSLLSLAIAYLVTLPYSNNVLGLTTIERTTGVLFLDWEDEKATFTNRWSALGKGFRKIDMPDVSIIYKRMTAPLEDSIEQLQNTIRENKIGLVIIDSLGPAVGGNLNDSEPAMNFHTALRELEHTSLILAHTSKDQLTKKKTIFGSVFFMNLSRSIWECKKEQPSGDSEVIISLKQVKGSYSKLHATLGFCFSFDQGGAVSVTKTNLNDMEHFITAPLPQQIKKLLLNKGPLSASDIAVTLRKDKDTVQTTLGRMKKELDNTSDHKWGLRTNDY